MLIVVLGLVVVAAPAQGATCQAPPGTSAIDQYCEVVPDGAGGSLASGGGPKTPGLSEESESALTREGADGQAIVELAQATSGQGVAPTGPNEDHHPDRDQKRVGAQTKKDVSQSTASRNGVLQATASSASQETERVGGLFIIVILLAVVAMGGWGWLRFRRSSVV
jgi:hypothetical protein